MEGQAAEGVMGNAYRILFGEKLRREVTWGREVCRWEQSGKLDRL